MERQVRAEDLRQVVAVIFERCGMSQVDATLLTDTFVTADLRGVHSHGVLRVGDYVKKLQTGGVDPAGRPRVVTQNGAALVVDGSNSMGQIGATFAMRLAIKRAHQTNVGVAVVRGSNHCGAMDYYAMLAAGEGMIGLATTNALPTMAPWGGVDKILGINPLGVAIPAGEESAIVFDAAFSASSIGKIRVYGQKGLAIPERWATDSEGRPTTDPAVAVEGLLAPIGQHKGTGLALVMGILSAFLSGARFGTELGNMVDGPKPGGDGHFLMALNVAAFVDPATFKHRVDSVIRQFHGSRPVSGGDRVYLPGERESMAQRLYSTEGIPLNQQTLDGVIATARELGVDPGPIT